MKNEKKIRFIDLFGGVGGFRLGLERANENHRDKSDISKKWKKNSRGSQSIQPSRNKSSSKTTFSCVWYCDNDKWAVQTYNKNFEENWKPADIKTIKAANIPDFDLLCAGFPCQSFSIAGKRRGFKDTRGTLFFEIARILGAKKPAYFLLENVKGLLNHEKGKTFRIILQTLDELGYDTQWMVLNSKFFGVPQNRERVFIIGNIRGKPKPKILPFRKSNSNIDKEYNKENATSETAQTVTATYHKGGKGSHIMKPETILDISQAQRVYSTDGTSVTIKAHGGGQGAKTGLYVVGTLKKIAKKRRFETPKEINEYLRKYKGKLTIKYISEQLKLPKTQIEHYFRTDIARAIPFPEVWYKLKKLLKFDNTFDKIVTDFYEKEVEYEQTRRAYSSKGVCPTINATQEPIISNKLNKKTRDVSEAIGVAQKIANRENEPSSNIRRLTPIECERLQGFPDNWTEGVSDTQRYRQMGNAVTVNVIEAIAKKFIMYVKV